MDTSPEFDPDAASYYPTTIGFLRWMIKLGRLDIIAKESLLSSYVELPREGHLEAAVHIMTHIGQRFNFRLVYDLLYPEIDHSAFKECDWSEFYRDANEAIPLNVPEF